MRDHDGTLSFAPRLPERLNRIAFGLCFRDRRLRVEVEHEQARYTLRDGPPLEIRHHGEALTITAGQPALRQIPPPLQRVPPHQPPGRAPARRQPAT